MLFFSPFYWPVHLAWEVVMEQAARAAGRATVFAGCDGLFSRCDAMVHEKHPGATCATCRFVHRAFFRALGGEPPVQPRDLIDLRAVRREAEARVRGLDHARLRDLRVDGYPVGAWARASVTRHLRTEGPGPGDEPVHRAFVASAIVALRACVALLDRVQPQQVVVLNGKFFAQRVMLELALERGIQVVAYERGNVKDTLVFAENRPAVPFSLDDLWREARDRALEPEQNERLDAYLRTRLRVGNAQVAFFDEPVSHAAQVRQALALDARPVDVLFTNLIWDSAVCGEDLAFPSMFDWVRAAVEEAVKTPERILVIRAHPAEVKVWWQPTRSRVGDALSRAFPELPDNVRFVPPESELDSYTLMDLAETGLVYTSTAGLEMVLRSRPVIVAGRSNYRDRGFTLDADSPGSFASFMGRRGRLPVTAAMQEQARRFAYLVYFVASVPVPWVEEQGALGFRFTVDSFEGSPPRLPFVGQEPGGAPEGSVSGPRRELGSGRNGREPGASSTRTARTATASAPADPDRVEVVRAGQADEDETL